MSSDDEERTFALTIRVKAPLRSALRAEADRRSRPGAVVSVNDLVIEACERLLTEHSLR